LIQGHRPTEALPPDCAKHGDPQCQQDERAGFRGGPGFNDGAHLKVESATGGQVEGIADCRKDACLAETRACRREKVVTELQTLAGSNRAIREIPEYRQ